MDLPDFSAYSEGQPKAFYLGASGGGFASLSDASFEVEGVKLPVHSQILSQHSRVLRDMFSELAGSASTTTLHEPFTGCTTRSVATFLRFLYCTDDACAANFNKLAQGSTMLEVVRLSHQLDAPALLAKLERHLASTVSSASLEVAVSWAELAEACHLDKLRLECIRQLAVKLAAKQGPPQTGSEFTCTSCGCDCLILTRREDSTRSIYCPHCSQTRVRFFYSVGTKQSVVEAVNDIVPLQGLSHESVMAVMAALVVGVRGRPGADHIPTAEDLAEAGALQAASAKKKSEG